MKSIGILEASRLLEISRQRIQQLIYANRVKGAYKTKKGWQIPLYGDMPRIIRGKRGAKGTWRVKSRVKPTIIHVNKHIIGANHHKEVKDPVIVVRKGSKVTYCSQVYFEGRCQIVYRPENKNLNGGAKVWIEVDATTKIFMESPLPQNSCPR
ncbi:hypothetical protein [Aphanothece sacrum]|uniref:Transcriptional regulator n=1 Tax=Aphanothece sacrum FPU1 TaxID=1920663 RepID=A0A401IBP5_APHSA|nr:hypothetical protein [Aphanothece sacrum]GBF78641.1 transcriptional regulator [Aphanothece sacrum FPU1]GBF84930.1 transcriptional regulator [Aphanothece sacrum FPU3]